MKGEWAEETIRESWNRDRGIISRRAVGKAREIGSGGVMAVLASAGFSWLGQW